MSAALDAAREHLAGARAWVVGGAVRDRLLHRVPTTVEVALVGDARAAARHTAVAVGGSVAPRGAGWGLLAPDGAWRLDLRPLRGEAVEDDLALRAFTVDAIAEPVAGGALVDPYDGAGDLARGRVRIVREAALAEEPLELLRLARLAAELRLAPDAPAVAAARAQAPGLAALPPERVLPELTRVLLAPEALDGFALLRRLGAYEAVLPELAACVGMAQNRFHHLDVHDHTLAVVQAAADLEARPAQFVGEELAEPVRALLAAPLAGGVTRGGALRFGALLHDIAKPPTRGFREDGSVTFIGHDREGAVLSREILARLGAPEALQAHVALLTREHLRLGFLVHREQPLPAETVADYLAAGAPSPADCTLLTVCDRVATRGDNAGPAIAAHLALARAVLPAALRRQSVR